MAKRPTIDPNRPFYVRKPLKCNGRNYVRGQEFDWKRQAVAWRRVCQLFAGRWLYQDADLHLNGRAVDANSDRALLEAGRNRAHASAHHEAATAEGAQFAPLPEIVDEVVTVERVAVPLEDLSLKELHELARERGKPTRRSKADQLAELR